MTYEIRVKARDVKLVGSFSRDRISIRKLAKDSLYLTRESLVVQILIRIISRLFFEKACEYLVAFSSKKLANNQLSGPVFFQFSDGINFYAEIRSDL